MPETYNILDAIIQTEEFALEAVRLGKDETAIIPFTKDSEKVELHYCPETEIKGYVICNGDGCILCQIGKRKEERLLLPVYVHAENRVMVLPVSLSQRPMALLPQLANVFKNSFSKVLFVTREGGKYSVCTSELPKDEAREQEIQKFLEHHKAGDFILSSVFPRYNNEQLNCVESIRRMIEIKGINQDNVN